MCVWRAVAHGLVGGVAAGILLRVVALFVPERGAAGFVLPTSTLAAGFGHTTNADMAIVAG